MKNIFFSLLLSAIVGGYSHAQSSDEHPYLTKSYAGVAISDVEVETSGGGIVLAGVDPSQARVEVYIRGNNGRELSNAEIEERLKDYYTVKVELDGGKLYATAKQKESWHNNWSHSLSISFKIYAPKSVSSHLNTSGGGIDIRDLAGGAQTFSTSGGGLEINNISGKIRGTTSGGGIHVSHASDDVDLNTSGGGIDADHCQGVIRLETSGGGLNLAYLSGKINANTSGGSVDGNHIDGDLTTSTSGGGIDLRDMACTLDASTSGGGIDVSMRALGKSLRLETSAGNITLTIPAGKGLDLTLDGDGIDTNNIGNFNGTTSRDHMKGSVNGGGIPIHLDASSGRISLTAK